jgi:hypothetical protein
MPLSFYGKQHLSRTPSQPAGRGRWSDGALTDRFDSGGGRIPTGPTAGELAAKLLRRYVQRERKRPEEAETTMRLPSGVRSPANRRVRRTNATARSRPFSDPTTTRFRSITARQKGHLATRGLRGRRGASLDHRLPGRTPGIPRNAQMLGLNRRCQPDKLAFDVSLWIHIRRKRIMCPMLRALIQKAIVEILLGARVAAALFDEKIGFRPEGFRSS